MSDRQPTNSAAATLSATGPREAADSCAGAVAAIDAAFRSSEGMAYLGEDVTMVQHQLQAGALARAAGSPDTLVVAALLHDIGHMVGRDEGELDATEAIGANHDAHHDAAGARWLARWFGPEVTEPVRLHVAAKRFLVATEADYVARLSVASALTLALQGGPMRASEVAAFRAEPHGAAALTVRRFDDAAKDASYAAPQLATHRAVIQRVLHIR